MALHYTFETDSRLLVLRGIGEVTLEERLELVDKIIEDRTLPRRLTVLINVTLVNNPPSNREIPWIGILLTRLQSRYSARIAIVNSNVEHTSISHLVAYATQSPPDLVRAFHSEGDAREWLA